MNERLTGGMYHTVKAVGTTETIFDLVQTPEAEGT